MAYPITERPIFALIIGINDYEDGSPRTLRGCVEDSNMVLAYLTDTLHVPRSSIVVLLNEQATRENIIDTFKNHFIDNSAIHEGDAIIFYFAGHGSRETAPDGWNSEDNKVETICPYDVVKAHGIPDYTLSHLLKELATRKGNNITMIFDSCHSGGMGRVEKETVEDAPLNRCYDPPDNFPALPADLDHEIWSSNSHGGRSLAMPELPGSVYTPMDTHVLLAACQPRQSALETRKGRVWSGAFTAALIASLKTWDPSTSLTYLRLTEGLSPLNGQHPHCEGTNKVRRLFSPSDAGKDDSSSFVVSAASTYGTYYVAVGYFLGVIKGTQFITHPPNGSTPLILVATIVEEFRCLAVPRLKDSTNLDALNPDLQLSSASILPHHSRATIYKRTTKWLQVELEPRDAFPHIIDDTDSLFSIVDSGGDIKASRTDGASKIVEISRHDSLICSQPECHQIPVDFDTFNCYYLDKAARFHYFLYQHRKSYTTPRLLDNSFPKAMPVTVSLRRLTYSWSLPARYPLYTPAGDNFFHAPADVASQDLSGAAELDGSSPNIQYALTLENGTSTDFFPYVFFFDPRTYGIVPLYLPHSPLSRPLTHGAALGIGYGSQGSKSMNFTLPEGINYDSAFIKIFVSTVYINMEAIVTKPERATKRTDFHTIEQCWDSWIYLITVRR